MRRVLVTTFEPFGGLKENSSHEVGQALPTPPGIELHVCSLPVVAGECVERAWEYVERLHPELVVALGQAGSSPHVRLEDRAINFDHFHTPDNADQVRHCQAIDPRGPALRRTPIRLENVVRQLRLAGHRVEISYSAGSYVCNHLYYQMLARAEAKPCVLFVHLPLLPRQLSRNLRAFTMPLHEQVSCVSDVLTTCLSCTGD